MADFETTLERALGDRIRADDKFAAAVWSSMANIIWNHTSGQEFATTFRGAGGLVAEIRRETGDMAYMNWYCSGPYAVVNDDVAAAMEKEGWTASPHPR
jgi:hypothetical protein